MEGFEPWLVDLSGQPQHAQTAGPDALSWSCPAGSFGSWHEVQLDFDDG